MRHVTFPGARGARFTWLVAAVCAALLGVSSRAPATLTLAGGGTTEYVIARSSSADSTEQKAATDLRNYLQTISGVTIPIQSYANLDSVPAKAIVVGSLASGSELGKEAFEMRAEGTRLILRGGTSLATRYAVFTFLEEKLGCRYYAPGVEKVPPSETIAIEPFDETQTPAFEMRHILQVDVTASANAEWRVRNKCNGVISISGTHTLYSMVPPATYFATHPEYYPLKNGVRTPDDIWFCFTNPDLPALFAAAINTRMAAQGADVIIDASQGDWYGSCACAPCQAAYAEEGNAWSGVMLRCLNQSADIVAQTYPNRRFSTFAYMHTEKPPALTQPAPNMVIRLVHWRHCDIHGLEECGAQNTFMNNLAGWQAITAPHNLYIWHYIVNFKSYLMPWPNVYSLIPDVKTYYDNGVSGLFQQGNYSSAGGDLSRLKVYLLAKAMWNPHLNAEEVLEDFLAGYYGDAAPFMAEYIDLLERTARIGNWHPNGITATAAHVETNVLTPTVFAEAELLFDQAEAAAETEAVRARIRYDRAALLYMRVYKKEQLERIEPPRLVKHGNPQYGMWIDEFLGTLGNRLWDEWSAQHRQVNSMKLLNAGPLLTVENETLRVEACPNLEGQIFAIVDKRTGRNLLHKARLSDGSSAYPWNGHYNETTGSNREACHDAQVTTAPDGGQVITLKFKPGSSSWSYNPPVEVVRTIRLEPDSPHITITSSMRNLTANPLTGRSLKAVVRYAFDNHQVELTRPDATVVDLTGQLTNNTTLTLPAAAIRLTDALRGIRLTNTFAPALPGSAGVSKNLTTAPKSIGYLFDTGTTTLNGGETKVLQQHTITIELLPFAPLSAGLAAAPASPRAVGVPISLTASAVNAIAPRYKFMAGETNLRGYATSSAFTWTPDTPGTYSVTAVVNDPDGANPTLEAVSDPIVYHIAPTLDAVALSPTPSEGARAGLPVTLTAEPTGGAQPVYQFRVNGEIVRAYGPSDTCAWTPAEAGDYTLTVEAKDLHGVDPARVVTSAPLPFAVAPPPLGVTLAVAPLAWQWVNQPVTLTATAVNGEDVEFRFYTIHDGVTSIIRPYDTEAVCVYTPASAGKYQFIVWARTVGNTAGRECYASLIYQVRSPLAAVNLTAAPPAMQPPGTPITLTATPVGGDQAEYRFYVAQPGGPLTMVRQYSPVNTCAFTPTQQGIHQFVVWARGIGSPNQRDCYRSITYKVAEPVTAVNLSAHPAAPQPPGVPLVLTAGAVGGFDVQYRFFAAPPNGALAQIRPYGRANTCGYTPALPGKYTFVVWAREVGSPNGWDAYRGMVFTVAGGTPLTGVSLAAAPPGSAAAGTPITLTATPAGGVAVSYRFFVSINGAAYTQIRAYHPDPQCVYTPPAAGNYTFLVWAREAGSTKSWDYYSTLPYRVTTGP